MPSAISSHTYIHPPFTKSMGLTRLLLVPRSRFALLQSLVGMILSYELLFGQETVIGGTTRDAIILGLMGMVIILVVMPSRVLSAKWFANVLVGCNTIMVTATIYLSGNARSDLYQAYFLLILIAASVRTLRHMLGLSIVLCLGYGGVLYANMVETGMIAVGPLLGIPVLLVMAVFYGVTLQDLSNERDQRTLLLTDIEALRDTQATLQRTRDELESRIAGLKTDLGMANEAVRVGGIERKGLEQELHEAHKMEAVGRLANGVAQEFSALLGVIGKQTGLILSTLKPNDPMIRPVEEIFKTGERAAVLTTHLLSLNKTEGVQHEVWSLESVLKELHSTLRGLLPITIELQVTLDPTSTAVQLDRDQIESIIFHLVVNARDAMPTGGRLVIQTKHVQRGPSRGVPSGAVNIGSHTLLVMSDTGGGMSLETQTRMFEPLFSTKDMHAGLGLTTVYRIVKQCEGYVDVDSKAGKGTVVTVGLPQATAVQASNPVASKALSARGNETILMVEEDDIQRKVAFSALSRHHYRVLEAGSAVEALMVAQRNAEPVHLLVSRLVMPDLGGKELAKRLLVEHPRMKALFLSGFSDDTILHHRIAQQCVLQQPYRAQALVERVREVLDWN